jgi:hypothetical protein
LTSTFQNCLTGLTESSELRLESLAAFEEIWRTIESLSNSVGQNSAAVLNRATEDCEDCVHDLRFGFDCKH